MYYFDRVVERLKLHFGLHYQNEVAKLLGIPQQTFATKRKRKSIPYKEIINVCLINRLNINDVFGGQSKDRLQDIKYKQYIKERTLNEWNKTRIWGDCNYNTT